MRSINKEGIDLLQFDLLQSQNLFHFTTTIQGGVSRDTYTSFNLGFTSGDNYENVYENRARLAALVDVSYSNLYIPHQVHEEKVCIIDSDFLSLSDEDKLAQLNGVDAIITDQKGICIGVTTADCVPLLIFDPQKNIFAAVHAGWKGTAARIAVNTIQKMKLVFDCIPADLLVGIAPCISSKIFEVGDEVGQVFENSGFELPTISYRNELTGKLHIDLRKANQLSLLELGILSQNIEISDFCTYSESDKFFSARRQSIYSGRMLTGGVLK